MQRLNMLFLCLVAHCSIGAQDTLGFLVKPYLQYSTQNEISILWETTIPASTTVRFGEAAFDVDQTPLQKGIQLPSHEMMHEVRLSMLKPETNYFWRSESVDESGDTLHSELYSFKTAVQDSSAYSFALIGDSQKNNQTPWAWSVISQEVWKERPHFIVHAGDLVDWGPKKTDWTAHFFPGGQALMARVPMFSVLGNHEGDADFYYQYMANPQPEYRYTFKYGNAEFFMIDTNRDVSKGSDQYHWLDRALAQSTAKWKFVIHHHPPYSSESDDHGDTFKEASTMGTKARDLTPLYDKYQVDFCLFGHTHVYERTWPLKNNRISEKDGVIYINSGGAGGGLETFAPTRNWFTLEVQEGHHFCMFHIYDETLVFQAIDHEGQVFDSFQLNKADKPTLVSSILQPPAPLINASQAVFSEMTTVTMEPGLPQISIHYTTDGTEPTSDSPRYNAPLMISDSTTLKARSYTPQGKTSLVVTKHLVKMAPIPATNLSNTAPGLSYIYYEGNWENQKDGYFKKANEKQTGVLRTLSFKDLDHEKAPYWGAIIKGYLNIPKTGSYTFYALDSRGLEITLSGEVMVKSAGERQTVKSLVLEKGKHPILIKTYQREWRQSLGFGYYDELLGRIPFKPFDLSH